MKQNRTAAKEMQSGFQGINGSMEDDLPERLRLGLAIHVGSVIVGEIDKVKVSHITEFSVGVDSSS